jgi:hypothetical protein
VDVSFLLFHLKLYRLLGSADRRDDLKLQVDLLAEKEITKVLQMVDAICGQMGLHISTNPR